MAGQNIVYKSFFYDDNGNYCTVHIKKEGYAGAETEVEMGPDPVVIKWVGSSDTKYDHIKPKEAYIQLVSSTPLQYLTMFTSPARTYEVVIYRGAAVVYTGFVNPEYYSEPFISAPHVITLHAIDGIQLLKNKTFPIPGYTKSDYKKSIIYYIHTALSQIGYYFNTMTYELALTLTAKKYDGTYILSRLAEEAFIDYRSLTNDDGDMPSCYDVLAEICSTFNMRLYQNGTAWRLERLNIKWQPYRLELYDASGMYSSTTAAQDDGVALTGHTGRGTDIRFKAVASLEVQPSYRSFDIVQDFGEGVNLIPMTNYAGMFTANDFTGGMVRYWSVNPSGPTISVAHESEWRALRLEGMATGAGVPAQYIYSDEISLGDYISSIEDLLTQWKAGNLTMKFSADMLAKYSEWSDEDGIQFFIKVVADFSGTQYTLDETISEDGIVGHFKEGPTSYNLIGYLYQEDWKGFTVVIPKPPDEESVSGQTYVKFRIYIYKGRATTANAGTINDGICIRALQFRFAAMQDTFYDTKIEDGTERTITTSIDEDNILEGDTYEVKYGDTPDPGGSGAYEVINRRVIFDDNNAALNIYGYVPDSHPSSSLVSFILKTDIFTDYRRPKFKLKGTILDTTTPVIDFTTCLEDYNDRKYIALAMAYHMKHVEYDGEWLEMYSGDGTGEFNDDFSEDFFI